MNPEALFNSIEIGIELVKRATEAELTRAINATGLQVRSCTAGFVKHGTFGNGVFLAADIVVAAPEAVRGPNFSGMDATAMCADALNLREYAAAKGTVMTYMSYQGGEWDRGASEYRYTIRFSSRPFELLG